MDYVKNYFDRYIEGLQKIDPNKIDRITNILYNAWKFGNAVFIIGNGGNASTASHMACDLGKGTLENHHDSGLKRLKISSLTDNVASMTALSNDLGYENVFSQQLINLGRHGDILIVMTASGNSPSIIKAIKTANDLGMATIGLLGFDGGKAKSILDHYIVYEEKHYGRVEDFHLMVNHILTEKLSELIRDEK